MVVTLAMSVWFVPNTSTRLSTFYSLLDKHEMLRNAGSPKIILVGGSNLSFGMDSRQIAEAFDMDVINMGIHAGIGLKYEVNDIKPFIKSGDIVVLVPEYGNFTEDGVFDGFDELVYLIFDVYPQGRRYIDIYQWMHLLKFIPNYGARKIYNYLKFTVKKTAGRPAQSRDISHRIYGRNSFNEYGDAVYHWTLKRENFAPVAPVNGFEYKDHRIIQFLNDFDKFVTRKGGRLFFNFPCLQATSFDNIRPMIDAVEKELRKLTFPVLSCPEAYRMPDEVCFNTPYHLTRAGVDMRTKRFISDLADVIAAKPGGED